MSTALIDDDIKLAQAARFLNVSPEYFQRLLEQGKVSFATLSEYKAAQQRTSQQALQQLIDQAQELDMGYSNRGQFCQSHTS